MHNLSAQSNESCGFVIHSEYGPADATATPLPLASLKSRMVYLSGASLTMLSGKKAIKWM